MKVFSSFLGLWLSALFTVNAVAADSVSVNLSGRVIFTPCVVDTTNSTTVVDLGDIQATSLKNAGSASSWHDFNIVLINCPDGLEQVVGTFHGTPSDVDPQYYKNAGTAKNVDVLIGQYGNGYPFSDGKTATKSVTNHTATFGLTSRAVSVTGSAEPGTIDAAVTMDISYN